jgi:hypothetical protein
MQFDDLFKAHYIGFEDEQTCFACDYDDAPANE